ncbi:MAG TPA: hypothetical protein VLE51_03705 [Candidatus Saccharimonadales bacterium]|nr:hypothetical protein [Candidatus Saccharimonadales bacterium]
MSIFELCVALNLPPEKFIVEGSGILDALGIREARDLDVVVEEPVFEELRHRGFVAKIKDEDPYLADGDIEAWLSFDGKVFAELMQEAVQIKGYNFTSLDLIRSWKQRRGLEKDKRDLILIEKYLKT